MNDASIYELYAEDAAKQEPTMTLTPVGDKKWWLHGKLHREDGAAVEYANGDKEWWLHGELHRENAPAIEYNEGTKAWWLHGKRHREDGAAIELANGNKKWYLHNKFYADADAWAEAVLKLRNEPCDAEAVQKFLRTILMKDDLI
jgi:hypothetical protein